MPSSSGQSGLYLGRRRTLARNTCESFVEELLDLTVSLIAL
jgi:hypothetical protein